MCGRSSELRPRVVGSGAVTPSSTAARNAGRAGLEAPPADYHLHTTLSDGEGSAAELVARAQELGLPEIGVADHVIGSSVDDGTGVRHERLEEYVTGVRAAGPTSGGPRVLVGMEVDYTRDTLDEVSSLVDRYRPDYVIGSVHLVDGFAFDAPRYIDDYRRFDLEDLWCSYFAAVAEAARSGLFTVLGHIDLIKKFGLRPPLTHRVAGAAETALVATAEAGAAVELNTSGWRHPVGEQYPSAALLRLARTLRIPLTFGSDAHEPGLVGADLTAAVSLARDAGYRSWLRLSDRCEVPLAGVTAGADDRAAWS